jgi:hypothetical protein
MAAVTKNRNFFKIGINQLKEKFHRKTQEYMLNYSLPCSCSLILSSFWFILRQQIFSSETAKPNYTKPGRDGPWVGPFQICV